ncbi:sulfur carrier protein ThiS [Acidocella sp.]|uniref:sulfur carrier protein ThiS n=1 Tax=Acidocella sp. TaxID=50710 RepID=UPI002625784C|nr:sulfur carrier protein ThiS [Acidocella sp.]
MIISLLHPLPGTRMWLFRRRAAVCLAGGGREADNGHMSQTIEQITLRVNGESLRVPAGTSVAGLVELMELDTRKLAVERNLEIVPRSQYAATVLEAGDALEIVHFVGGG